MDVPTIILCTISSVTGSLSTLGSCSLIYLILSDRERKLGRPYHRLMLSMSCFDVFQSIAIALSPLPIPRETGIYGAKGNSLTCTVQGILITLGLAVPLYNSGLNVFYMLTIRYGFSSEQFAKYEPFVHATGIMFPVSMAVISTVNDYISARKILCYPRSKLTSVI